MRSLEGRRGVSLPETIVGVLLGALVLQVGWTLLSVQGRTVRELIRAVERAESAGTIRGVLHAELRAGRADVDWRLMGDSVDVRSFRGSGVPCGPPDHDGVPVTHRGRTRPRPGVDSILSLGPDGAWRAALLAGASPAPGVCPAGRWGRSERWVLDPAPDLTPVLLRLFRRGSYHLSENAFRYRRGHGGRQPLTPAVLDDAASSFEPGADGSVRLRLRFRGLPPRAGLNPWSSTLWPTGG